MTARCVELTAVYDDGTVERWEGEPQGPAKWQRGPAQSVLDKYESQHEEYSGFKADGSCRVPWPASTVTRPARKVTVVRGYHYRDGECDYISHPDECEGPGTPVEEWLPDVAKAGRDHSDPCEGPLGTFRVTVEFVPDEAVPVEVKP